MHAQGELINSSNICYSESFQSSDILAIDSTYLVYAMKESCVQTQESKSAHPTIPETASVWMGCRANKMTVTFVATEGAAPHFVKP